MATNSAAGLVATDVVEGQGKPYQLCCKARTKGNPIIILVHGAVVPTRNGLHKIDCRNNYRYCFYDLDTLLYHDFQYNVFTFEYADENVLDLGYVNYHKLCPYVVCLIDAVGKAKNYAATQGPVTFIAHSMGGLVARCAAKKMSKGSVSKIITLDTGNLGSGLANLIEKIIPPDIHPPPPFDCYNDVKEGSTFMQKLNDKFDAKNPELVSLAALDPVPKSFFEMELPPDEIKVVGLHSSSMGQVDDDGNPTSINYNMPFHRLHCNHMTIAQITTHNYQNHPAYQIIKNYV